MPTIPISKPFYPANEMKKITYLATICGLILLGLSSCQKENLKGGQFTATIAQMNNDDKVTYDGQGFAWQDGDLITVFRKDISSTSRSRGRYSATLGDGNNSSRATFNFVDPDVNLNKDVTDNSLYEGIFLAIYPYSIAPHGDGFTHYNRVRLPATQTLTADNNNLILEGFPMYAECGANSRLLKFKNLCGLLKLHLEKANTTISSITISTEDASINGLFNIVPTHDDDEELVSATLSPEPATDESKNILVQFPAQNISNGKDFFIALPARDYQTLTITITDNTGKVCTKSLNSTHTFHIGASEWSSITLQNEDLVFEEVVVNIPGALPGVFTVGAGKTVVFSQGNLKYRPSNNYYQFAEQQYDSYSYVNGQNYQSLYDATSTDWIELFPWGTSGYNDKYPYYYSASASDYGNGNNPIAGTNYDWGIYNPISNGGNTAGLWRTLTKDEWNYLFKQRTDAVSKWTKATVNGVYGTIILPDSWNIPSGINMTMATTNWNTNVYNIANWEALEDAGAVFLPITGYLRYGGGNDYVCAGASSGYYWSVTNSNSSQAIYTTLSKSSNNFTSAGDKGRCLAVRLVHDVD